MPQTRPEVNQFYKTALEYGFNKKYNFQVESISPLPTDVQTYVDNFEDYNLYVQSASVPTRKISIAKVPYKAFEFVVPTNVVYSDNENWSVEFISDNYNILRSLFEVWSKVLYDNSTNSTSDIDFAKTNLKLNLLADAYVAGSNEGASQSLLISKVYTLYGLFPTYIEPIAYNISDAGTEVAKFKVTFAYQYFEMDDSFETPDMVSYTKKTDKFNKAAANGTSGLNPAKPGLTLLGALNSITKVARGVGNTANALRYASRSIRGK